MESHRKETQGDHQMKI